MKVKSSVLISLVLFFFMKNMSIAHADHENRESNQSSEASERTKAYSRKSLSSYRKELRVREKEFYEAFNQLVDDPEMETHCGIKTSSSFSSVTNLKKTVCEPSFVAKIRGEEKQKARVRDNANSMQGVLNVVVNQADVDKKIEEKRHELAVKMFELVNANPELMKKYQNLQKAKLDYEAKK